MCVCDSADEQSMILASGQANAVYHAADALGAAVERLNGLLGGKYLDDAGKAELKCARVDEVKASINKALAIDKRRAAVKHPSKRGYAYRGELPVSEPLTKALGTIMRPGFGDGDKTRRESGGAGGGIGVALLTPR